MELKFESRKGGERKYNPRIKGIPSIVAHEEENLWRDDG